MDARSNTRLTRIIAALFAAFVLGGCATVIDSTGERFYRPWWAEQSLHPEWNSSFPRESLRLPPSPRPDPLPERKHYENWKDLSEYALAPSAPQTAAMSVADNAGCVAQCPSSLETTVVAARVDAHDSRGVIGR